MKAEALVEMSQAPTMIELVKVAEKEEEIKKVEEQILNQEMSEKKELEQIEQQIEANSTQESP